MDRVLIDTDVILDFFFDRKPFSQSASDILTLCANKKLQGYITPVIVSNVYYILRKTTNHIKVIEKLKQLLNFIEILNIDKNIVLSALASNFNDFEDALQNFAAVENNKIRTIITRNHKDFKNSSLAIFSPETFLKSQTKNEK